ncbi:hypothetical protein HN031_15630 [Nocardioides sp. zg-1308]|uniref:hypothetical protein n=1 Tax=Nocardioides sp. zg-1308 TaxID=2736253 RepID=UPI00155633DC|nr:hypothetical protein [Nocardioides sp. zg-1308]NPD06110.1 hypothetical protein [Nocardioides sp. zg-1308]
MTDTVLAALALLTIVWAVTSSRLADWDVTGALVFLAAGFALANPTWGRSVSTSSHRRCTGSPS